MTGPIIGECAKHPGNNMVNCALCSLEAITEKLGAIDPAGPNPPIFCSECRCDVPGPCDLKSCPIRRDDPPPLREVTTIYEHNLLDVPNKLRDLATRIERGDYGAIGCCAVALMGDQLTSHSYGPDSAPPSAACVLQAAAQLYFDALKEHGRPA